MLVQHVPDKPSIRLTRCSHVYAGLYRTSCNPFLLVSTDQPASWHEEAMSDDGRWLSKKLFLPYDAPDCERPIQKQDLPIFLHVDRTVVVIVVLGAVVVRLTTAIVERRPIHAGITTGRGRGRLLP